MNPCSSALPRKTVHGVALSLALAAGCWGAAVTQLDAASPPNAPTIATEAQLKTVVKTVKHPVYWLGPRSGFKYEFTLTEAGRIFIRYLPAGVRVGDKRPIFRTVATYPVNNATKELQGAAKRLKRPVRKVGKNGVAFTGRPPTSVFLAFGSSPFQIEVYSPSAALTQNAAFGGSLTKIS